MLLLLSLGFLILRRFQAGAFFLPIQEVSNTEQPRSGLGESILPICTDLKDAEVRLDVRLKPLTLGKHTSTNHSDPTY